MTDNVVRIYSKKMPDIWSLDSGNYPVENSLLNPDEYYQMFRLTCPHCGQFIFCAMNNNLYLKCVCSNCGRHVYMFDTDFTGKILHIIDEDGDVTWVRTRADLTPPTNAVKEYNRMVDKW